VISFRYHIASLVAVLLALAAGVALGSGPLQREDDAPTTTSGPTSTGSAADNLVAAFNDSFVASLQAGILTNRLKGRTVTVLVLPGAPAEEVTGLSTAVRLSGASITGTLRVGPTLVDASKKTLVDELGGQLEAQSTKVTVDSGAGSYDRIGTLLAYAVGTTTATGDAIDQQGQGILAGLSTAGLISTDDQLQRRGNLVLVVAGAPDDGSGAEGAASIVLSLSKALDGRTGGVVLAGPAEASDPTGVLTAVRNDPAAALVVSTVDSADHAAGAMATVLAMQEQAGQKAGQYGGGPGATGPRPSVTYGG